MKHSTKGNTMKIQESISQSDVKLIAGASDELIYKLLGMEPVMEIKPKSEVEKRIADLEENVEYEYCGYKYSYYIYSSNTSDYRVYYVYFAGKGGRKSAMSRCKNTTGCKTIELAKEFLKQLLESAERKVQRKEKAKQELKDKRGAYVNPYKVGDLFNKCFSYNMTFNSFYQVVSVGKMTIKLRKIASINETFDGWSGNVRAEKDAFTEDETIYIARITVTSYGVSIKMDGRSMYPTTEEDSHYENHLD